MALSNGSSKAIRKNSGGESVLNCRLSSSNDKHNNNLYQKYKALADEYNAKLCSANDLRQQDNVNDDQPPVIFGGRLAEYKYYDMAPVVDKVLRMFD